MLVAAGKQNKVSQIEGKGDQADDDGEAAGTTDGAPTSTETNGDERDTAPDQTEQASRSARAKA